MSKDARDQELELNAVLAAPMAELRQEVPPVDWDRLRRSINGRAELGLRRRRKRRSGSRVRALVPLSAAAGIALALWFGADLVRPASGPDAPVNFTAMETEELLVEALLGDLSEKEFELLVLERANPEDLLSIALGQR